MIGKSWPVKIISYGQTSKSVSDFDFEVGKYTLMHLRMLSDASVHLFNLLTASNLFQWNELSVVLVSQSCLKRLLSSQYCEKTCCCYSLFLMPVIKFETLWMLRWCEIHYHHQMKQVCWKQNWEKYESHFHYKDRNLFVNSFVVKQNLPIYWFNSVLNTLSILVFCSPRQATHMEGDIQWWG